MRDPIEESSLPNATKVLMIRMHDAAETLSRRGARWARYFARIDSSDVATQRDTKTHLNKRLRASEDGPQVVTLQARAGQKGGSFLIMPLETVVETLEATATAETFVPITATMRDIGGEIELPVLTPHGTGRRLRTAPTPLPSPVSGT